MSVLTVLHYPDPRLQKIAKPVDFLLPGTTARLQQLTQDMLDTMYAEQGVGLAATQVDVHERVVVVDVASEGHDPQIFINPEIIWQSAERAVGSEGCLSVPDVRDKVERAERVHVRTADIHGNLRTVEAEGLLAVCLQHELDHLQGKVFIEYLSLLKRTRIKTKLTKAMKAAQTAA